jgi:ornithine decarboxylase
MKTRVRSAVSPLRRGFVDPLRSLPTVDQIVAIERPEEPLHALRPAQLEETARAFTAAFPGEVLYAVKCNPEPAVLRALAKGGVAAFDCASPAEVALVRSMFPKAHIAYMHPVKSRGAIAEAMQRHGVRDFVLDHPRELDKLVAIAAASGIVRDELGLIVRIALPKGTAVYDLSGKFGAAKDEAIALLAAARAHAGRFGLSFHVGSQCLEPYAYTRALALAGEVAEAAQVTLDIIDVGGGFPVSYPGVTPPPLAAFIDAIRAGLAHPRLKRATLWAEPGRALAAGGMSLVVQVQRRKGDTLYINDGVYGSLSDAGVPGFRFPARAIAADGRALGEAEQAFRFYGPTCDSADRMEGPFPLPAAIEEGDWIEIGQLGAYGGCLRTAFNGFDRARIVEVRDAPLVETPGYKIA